MVFFFEDRFRPVVPLFADAFFRVVFFAVDFVAGDLLAVLRLLEAGVVASVLDSGRSGSCLLPLLLADEGSWDMAAAIER